MVVVAESSLVLHSQGKATDVSREELPVRFPVGAEIVYVVVYVGRDALQWGYVIAHQLNVVITPQGILITNKSHTNGNRYLFTILDILRRSRRGLETQ